MPNYRNDEIPSLSHAIARPHGGAWARKSASALSLTWDNWALMPLVNCSTSLLRLARLSSYCRVEMSQTEQHGEVVDLSEIRWKMLVACDLCRRRKVRFPGCGLTSMTFPLNLSCLVGAL